MPARRILHVGFISALAMVAGCSHSGGGLFSSGAATPPQAVAPPNNPANGTANVQPGADSLTPEQLAAKVASFTEGISASPENKTHAATTGAKPAAATTEPTVVALENLTPLQVDASIHFSPYQQDDSPPKPAARPTVVAPAPGPVVSASGESSYPLTVPEGVDRPGQHTSPIPDAQPGQAVQAAMIQGPAGRDGQSPIWSADQAERQLARRIRDYPKDLGAQLNYQLLLFVEGQPVPAMTAMSGLAAEDREVMSALMDGLVNFRSVARASDNPLLSAKVKPLLDMADRLRTQSELTISPIVQCTEVHGYGLYTPMAKSRFIAGLETNAVVIYTEVQNFQSQLTSDNQWQTRLTAQTVLYTDTGLAVWPAKPTAEPVVDLCRQHKHDLFVAIKVPLPKNLSIGRYLLKLTVTDQQANHIAEATTPLEIVAE